MGEGLDITVQEVFRIHSPVWDERTAGTVLTNAASGQGFLPPGCGGGLSLGVGLAGLDFSVQVSISYRGDSPLWCGGCALAWEIGFAAGQFLRYA